MVKPMRYSKALLDLLESFEGCELKAYQDNGGVWTIGYGHTKDVYPGMWITLQQAENFADQDLSLAESYVNAFVYAELSQNEFDALVDFVFNLGAENFRQSTMLSLLNEGDYRAAADQFARWDRCKGVILAGLLRRRLAEKALFQTA